ESILSYPSLTLRKTLENPLFFSSTSFFRDLEANIGIKVKETNKDMTNEKATVKANSLKIVAVIHSTNTIGANTAIVVMVEAVLPLLTSLSPSILTYWLSKPFSLSLYIFSNTTIELSTSIPIPKAIPPKVIILKVILPKYNNINVAIIDIG